MKLFKWSQKRVLFYVGFSLLVSLLINLGNDFNVNILNVLRTWFFTWIIPAFVFFNAVFEEVKNETKN